MITLRFYVRPGAARASGGSRTRARRDTSPRRCSAQPHRSTAPAPRPGDVVAANARSARRLGWRSIIETPLLALLSQHADHGQGCRSCSGCCAASGPPHPHSSRAGARRPRLRNRAPGAATAQLSLRASPSPALAPRPGKPPGGSCALPSRRPRRPSLLLRRSSPPDPRQPFASRWPNSPPRPPKSPPAIRTAGARAAAETNAGHAPGGERK